MAYTNTVHTEDTAVPSLDNEGVQHTVLSVKTTDGQQIQDIVTEHVPDWFRLFAQKNAEYGENASVLGDKGQFADMWRKMGKLKTAMWDGNEDKLVSEGVDEILHDLIGHCFLTLQIRAAARPKPTVFRDPALLFPPADEDLFDL